MPPVFVILSERSESKDLRTIDSPKHPCQCVDPSTPGSALHSLSTDAQEILFPVKILTRNFKTNVL